MLGVDLAGGFSCREGRRTASVLVDKIVVPTPKGRPTKQVTTPQIPSAETNHKWIATIPNSQSSVCRSHKTGALPPVPTSSQSSSDGTSADHTSCWEKISENNVHFPGSNVEIKADCSNWDDDEGA